MVYEVVQCLMARAAAAAAAVTAEGGGGAAAVEEQQAAAAVDGSRGQAAASVAAGPRWWGRPIHLPAHVFVSGIRWVWRGSVFAVHASGMPALEATR